MSIRQTVLSAVLLVGATMPALSQVAEDVAAPGLLDSNAVGAGARDESPSLATDGNGTWVAVWQSEEDFDAAIGADADILVSHSEDEGATWEASIALNTNAADDEDAIDAAPVVATDGAGRWVAIWASNVDEAMGISLGTDFDILVATSDDDGRTWTDPAPLNPDAATDDDDDTQPALTTDSAGLWAAVWRSDTDSDIVVALSTDDGATWSDAESLDADATTDGRQDSSPNITASPTGRWVVVWTSTGGQFGDDGDILWVEGVDTGATGVQWEAPNAVDNDDDRADDAARVATDGAGNWAIVWEATALDDSSREVFTARRTDDDGTWTDVGPRTPASTPNDGRNMQPDLSTDGFGTWVAVWSTNDTVGQTLGTDRDIVAVRSVDNGATWSEPQAINTTADADGAQDHDDQPRIVADGAGNWVSIWRSNADTDNADTDLDLLRTRFTMPLPDLAAVALDVTASFTETTASITYRIDGVATVPLFTIRLGVDRDGDDLIDGDADLIAEIIELTEEERSPGPHTLDNDRLGLDLLSTLNDLADPLDDGDAIVATLDLTLAGLDEGAVLEADETTNNTIAEPVTVDLVAESVTLDENQQATLTYLVNSPANVAPFTVAFYLDTVNPGRLDPTEDTKVDPSTTPIVTPGTHTLTADFTALAPAAGQLIFADIDTDNQVVEANENNNEVVIGSEGDKDEDEEADDEPAEEDDEPADDDDEPAADDGETRSGSGVTDANGSFSDVVTTAAGQALAAISIRGAAPNEMVSFSVTDPPGGVAGAPGPGNGTIVGFRRGVGLGRALTAETTALPGSYLATISITFTAAELSVVGITNPGAVQMHRLSTLETPARWVSGGTNVGAADPTGIVGDSGFVTNADDSVTFWAELSRLSTFAVGAPSDDEPPDDDAAQETPDDEAPPIAALCGPGACGVGGPPTMLLTMLGLVMLRCAPRPRPSWKPRRSETS